MRSFVGETNTDEHTDTTGERNYTRCLWGGRGGQEKSHAIFLLKNNFCVKNLKKLFSSSLQWFYVTNKIERKATWNDLLYTYLGNYLFTRFINETYIFDNDMHLFKYSGKNNLCFI